MTWVNMILKFVMTGLTMWHLVDNCSAQYANTFTDPWYQNFNMLSNINSPVVEASGYQGDYSTMKTVTSVIKMVLQGLSIYLSGKS